MNENGPPKAVDLFDLDPPGTSFRGDGRKTALLERAEKWKNICLGRRLWLAALTQWNQERCCPPLSVWMVSEILAPVWPADAPGPGPADVDGPALFTGPRREPALASRLRKWLRGGYGSGVLYAAARAWNRDHCDPPLSGRKRDRVFDSACLDARWKEGS